MDKRSISEVESPQVGQGGVDYDIVVAGGGPAGLAAAKVAADRGLSVLLVEKHQAFGIPTRTSGGSFVADLQALGIPAHLYHPITHARLIGPTRETTVTKEGYGCVLDVRALYQWLAAEAGQAGAHLRLRTTAQDILRDHTGHVRGVKLRDHTGQVTDAGCRLVIDATGFASTLSVKGGVHPHFKRAGVGAEYDLYAPNWPEDTYTMMVGNGIAPAGYAWVFPYGNHRVRAGIGVLRPDVPADPMAYLDLLINGTYLPTAAGLEDAVPIELHDGVIPAEGLQQHLVADGIITAGDAGGQSSTLFGEGIRFALWAGRLAAKVAADALAAGDVSASALRIYEQRWGRQWASKLRHAYTINKLMAAFADEDWDDAIRLLADCAPSDYVRLIRTDLTAAVALGAVIRRPQVLRTVAKQLTRRYQAANVKRAAV